MKSWAKSEIRKYLGPVLVFVGLAYTYHSHITGCPRYVIFAGWALGPPVWFILEYGHYLTQKMKTLAHSDTIKASAETFGWDSWPI